MQVDPSCLKYKNCLLALLALLSGKYSWDMASNTWPCTGLCTEQAAENTTGCHRGQVQRVMVYRSHHYRYPHRVVRGPSPLLSGASGLGTT